jgi:hypothetical protein
MPNGRCRSTASCALLGSGKAVVGGQTDANVRRRSSWQ